MVAVLLLGMVGLARAHEGEQQTKAAAQLSEMCAEADRAARHFYEKSGWECVASPAGGPEAIVRACSRALGDDVRQIVLNTRCIFERLGR